MLPVDLKTWHVGKLKEKHLWDNQPRLAPIIFDCTAMRIPPTFFCSSLWAVLSTTVLLFYCIAHVGQCHRNNKKKPDPNKQQKRVCVCVFYNFFSFLFYLAVNNRIFTVHSRLGLLVQLSQQPHPPLINITSFQSSVCGHAQRGPPASTDTGGGGEEEGRRWDASMYSGARAGGRSGRMANKDSKNRKNNNKRIIKIKEQK